MFISGSRGLPAPRPAPKPAPRPALPPILPAPRGTPTYRPGQAVNNAAVQRYEPAPVRAAQHQAAQRAAYVAAPHHFSPAAAPVNTSRSPAAATTQRLAKAIGSPRPSISPAERGSRLTDFYVRAPTSAFGAYAAYEGSQGIRNSTYQSYFDQVFRNLQNAGLVSKRAAEPALSFPAPGTNPSTDAGGSYTSGQHITISPLAVAGVTSPLGRTFGGYGKETAVHELAHTQQKSALIGKYPADRALVEGGAQAFADAASFAAGTGPIPQQDGNYSGYVQQVRRMGPGYYMRGQFGLPSAIASPRPPHRRNQ